MCVLFAACLIYARQDSPGERRSGVLGKQLQPSHCINKGASTDFWLVSSSTAPWIWQILLIAFAHVFIFGFVFPLLCSSSKFHRRKHTAVTPQELNRRQWPLEPPLPPAVLMQARTKSLSFIPSFSPGQTDSPRLWWIITSSFQAVVAVWIKIYLRILTKYRITFKTTAPRSFGLP